MGQRPLSGHAARKAKENMSQQDENARLPEEGTEDPFARWTQLAQIPILIGLAFGMILFVVTFFVDIYDAVRAYEFLDRKKTILLILNLLDMVFIANLVIMVAANTYNSFARWHGNRRKESPDWDETAYRRMKHRIVSTIVIISSIHVLSELLEFDQLNWSQSVGLIGFHLALLATYIATNVFRSND